MTDYSFYVYITTNPGRTTFYVGMTNDLAQRMVEHYLNRGKRKTFPGRYYCYDLVYYEEFQWVHDAQAQEKELKGWLRKKKLDLVRKDNPGLKTLNSAIMDFWPPKDGSSRG